jgi:hypothetical protein
MKKRPVLVLSSHNKIFVPFLPLEFTVIVNQCQHFLKKKLIHPLKTTPHPIKRNKLKSSERNWYALHKRGTENEKNAHGMAPSSYLVLSPFSRQLLYNRQSSIPATQGEERIRER